MVQKSPKTYQAMSSELYSILFELQQEDLYIEAAVGKYERGLELIAELEKYLKAAENRVVKLKSKSQDKAS